MNLIVDAGNTMTKFALFQLNEIQEQWICESQLLPKKIQEFQYFFKDVEKVMVSSVGIVPFKNEYSTPKTLGVDRIALVSAAVSEFPNQNCLVIDAGTCITYDFLNDNKVYLGGGIAPGLQLRYKSLPNYTANLPLLTPKLPDTIVGDSTENAIHVGISLGLICEIDGIIQEFSNTYESLVVILTGGDANFLSKRLKSGIFVDLNFLIKGLNTILEYTIDK